MGNRSPLESVPRRELRVPFYRADLVLLHNLSKSGLSKSGVADAVSRLP
jgi:hypothetical protein